MDLLPAPLVDAFASYKATANQLLDSLEVPASLSKAYGFWSSLPQLPILIGHCIFCTTFAPETRGNFVLHYWLTFLAGSAGGPLSALLIMNPERAPISLFASNKLFFTWTLVWWAMTYSPLSRLLQRVHSFWPLKAVTKACVSYMRASIICGRVALATELFPHSMAAPLILGTIGACGGKSTYDIIRYLGGLATGPVEVSVPSYSLRSAFLGAAIVYFSSKFPATAFLAHHEAAGLLISLFVLHSLLADLTGRPLDWSALLLRIILRVANTPYPASAPPTVTTPVKAPADSKHTNGHAKSAVANAKSAVADAKSAVANAKSSQQQTESPRPGHVAAAPQSTGSTKAAPAEPSRVSAATLTKRATANSAGQGGSTAAGAPQQPAAQKGNGSSKSVQSAPGKGASKGAGSAAGVNSSATGTGRHQ